MNDQAILIMGIFLIIGVFGIFFYMSKEHSIEVGTYGYNQFSKMKMPSFGYSAKQPNAESGTSKSKEGLESEVGLGGRRRYRYRRGRR
jgi:hypothetical protein